MPKKFTFSEKEFIINLRVKKAPMKFSKNSSKKEIDTYGKV